MKNENVIQKEDADSVHRRVSEAYAQAVTAENSSCCPPHPKGVAAQSAGYSEKELCSLPEEAATNSFGCGNPLAFAEVQAGQTVLDLGCGAGIDLILAAQKVGPTGHVIGVDMTDEMLRTARVAVDKAGLSNVELKKGHIENLPVGDGQVDWVISNCVINLSPDKASVFREIHRVLKPGGQMLVSDIVSSQLPALLRENTSLYCSCIAGSLSEEDYCHLLRSAGMAKVEVQDRLVYTDAQLQAIAKAGQSGPEEGSSCCGAEQPASDITMATKLLEGSVWSARIYARKEACA